ncbi:MAG: HD domain-containing phosphohydrolase [Thermomicrobiales bacterium]
MSTTPKRTIGYTVGLATILGCSLYWTGDGQPSLFAIVSFSGIAVLFGLALIAGLLDIRFPFPNGASFSFTADAAIALAIGIVLGPFWGTLLVMASTLTLDLLARRPPLKIAVNSLNLGFSTLAASLVYHGISDAAVSPFASRESVIALGIASLTYTVVNLTVLSFIVSPVIGISPVRMWLANLPPVTVELITLPSLGGIVPVLYNEHPLAPGLVVVPLAAPFLAFRALRQVEQETRATIEALADALEHRDRYTHQHSVRVAGYVSAILDQMPHIPVQAREVILSAARVHDVGKVGISDSTLNKPGKLSREEWSEVQRHAEIGSDLVNRLSIYRNEATVVRHHHERWDGGGYPDGLAGNEIPLGSRIIGVADAFDAMTSDRAYRSGMSPEAAIATIADAAGTQFDPEITVALQQALGSRLGPSTLSRTAQVAETALAGHGSGVVHR